MQGFFFGNNCNDLQVNWRLLIVNNNNIDNRWNQSPPNIFFGWNITLLMGVANWPITMESLRSFAM